jgi:hypothetical protein
LQLQTAGTTALTVTSAQKVGVGTTSPLGTFGVVGSTTTTIVIPCSSNGTTGSPVETQIIGSTYTNGSYGAGIYALNAFNSSSANWLAFKTTDTGNGSPTTQMTLDASGQLGVGTSSPGSKLEVSNTVNTAYDPTNTLTSGQTARITNLSTTSGVASTLFFKAVGTGGDNSYATISCVSSGTGASVLTFGVKQASGYGVVEAMRITPSGQMILNPNGGTAPPYPALWVYGGGSGTKGAIRIGDSSYPSNGNYWEIGRDNTVTGNFTFSLNGTQNSYIQANTGVYVAVSDSRVKRNIVNSNYGLAEVLRLRPVMYNMILEEENVKQHIGFIAQEVKAVIDESVDDLIDESQQFYGLDKSVFVPVLVQAIQELSALVTAQSATITSLTERITALEGK